MSRKVWIPAIGTPCCNNQSKGIASAQLQQFADGEKRKSLPAEGINNRRHSGDGTPTVAATMKDNNRAGFHFVQNLVLQFHSILCLPCTRNNIGATVLKAASFKKPSMPRI